MPVVGVVKLHRVHSPAIPNFPGVYAGLDFPAQAATTSPPHTLISRFLVAAIFFALHLWMVSSHLQQHTTPLPSDPKVNESWVGDAEAMGGALESGGGVYAWDQFETNKR